MSGLINKVKEKIAEVKADHNSSSTNAGPHDSNAANKVDPRVDSDLDGRGVGHHGTTGTSHTTGLGSSTHHTTGTGITGTSGIGSSGANTTVGPHSSDTANKLDPRVDSDLSGGHPGSSNTAYGTTGHSSGLGSTGTHTTGTHTTGTHSGSNTAGPHSSDLANKLDPRVDSDLSGGHPGSNQTFTHTGQTSTTGTSGLTGSHGSSGLTGSSHNTTYGSTNAGPHDSNALNKLDPRVDSDLDGGRHAGLNQTTGTHGTTGTGFGHSGSTNAGPYDSNIANKLDPRVDSDLDGGRHAGLNQTTGNHGTTGIGGTTHSSSTGPVHNSSLLNKLDPRVDSDADGSRNAGIAKTSTTHNAGSTQGVELDAATHRPSDFAAVHGDPTVHHNYPEQASHRRHGSISKDDQHYGSGAI